MKIARLLMALAMVAGLGGMARAQAKRPMTFADLMAMKRVSDPQISPSGKWVLFSVTDVSLAANSNTNHLWVVPIGGGPSPSQEKQVTFGAGESNGRFSPDGKWVSATVGDQVVLLAWDEATGTVKATGTTSHVATAADGAIWSADAKRLLFVSQVYPECSDKPAWADEDACDKARDDAAAANQVKAQLWTGLLYRHWNAFTGLKRSHVLVMDADLSHVRDLTPRSVVGDAETPTFSLGGPLGYAWAPDSKEIAYVTNLDKVPAASTNNDVFTLRLDEPGVKAVKVSTSLGSDDGPQYSPDGKWLAFRSQARAGYESDRFRLMVFDREAKTTRELLPKFDRWVDEFVWTPASNGFFIAAGYGGEVNVFGASLSGNSGDISLAYLQGEGDIGEIKLTSSGTTLVGTRMTAISPSEVFILNLSYPNAGHMESEWGGEEAISHQNDSVLNSLNLTKLQAFHFAGAGGTRIDGFMVKPPNFDPSKKYPVKFLIHGGPQGAWGDAWSYRWNPELMAASGYVVVMVNPRGSTGYGQAFIDGVNGDWGGKAYIDLMKGMDAAEQQFPFIDRDRECALGASYGGFMANWILTHSNRFKCIVSHDGMYNPVSAYGTTEELWFNEWEFRRPGDPLPGQPWRYASLPADQDPFRKWSPALFIQNAKTPTLVIHSQKDYRLDVSEGYQLYDALQRLGVPSEMLYFPDEGHWVLKPQNSELWNKTVSDWCDQWTHTNAYAAK